MSQPTLVYRHARNPGRGLAVTGIILIKMVLALPHLVIIGALQNLGVIAAYIGYFVKGGIHLAQPGAECDGECWAVSVSE